MENECDDCSWIKLSKAPNQALVHRWMTLILNFVYTMFHFRQSKSFILSQYIVEQSYTLKDVKAVRMHWTERCFAYFEMTIIRIEVFKLTNIENSHRFNTLIFILKLNPIESKVAKKKITKNARTHFEITFVLCSFSLILRSQRRRSNVYVVPNKVLR